MTISDVPRKQKGLYSGIVSEIIKYILLGNEEAWKALFLLPRLVFALPRGGSKISRQVRIYLNLFRSGQWEALLARKVNHVGEACLGGQWLNALFPLRVQDMYLVLFVRSRTHVSAILPISAFMMN